jgi:hypothetical protein
MKKLWPFLILIIAGIILAGQGGTNAAHDPHPAGPCPAGSYDNGGSCVYP